MNKYNIEVGDKLGKDAVTLVDVKGISFSKDRFPSVHLYTWEYIEDLVNKSKEWKLTKATKMNKKIIGYTLLKDTPIVKAGSIYKDSITRGYYVTKAKDGGDSTIKIEYLSDTEWFSPIYEEDKPSAVYVDTLAGKVKVTKDYLFIDADAVSIKDVKKVFKQVESFRFTTGEYSDQFQVTINSFKVGCKEFSVNDIPKIEKAIKQVS